jgi:hypothetical protein
MPPFDSITGYLPPGVHSTDWPSFLARFAWNAHRAWLCAGLYRALNNLRNAGCAVAIVDGSFVTAKEIPGDYDAAFDPAGVVGALLDPILLRHADGRLAMKAKYLGEVFPWGWPADTAGKIYLDFFQSDRVGVAKGVVQLDLGALP